MQVNMPYIEYLGVLVYWRVDLSRATTNDKTSPTEETFSLRHGTHGHGALANVMENFMDILLMAEILHQLISSLSHYL